MAASLASAPELAKKTCSIRAIEVSLAANNSCSLI
ncbi:Uncharacterised protein [Legionella pneumophila]|nr:Uncharacterised protein [Legionella pneumophila]